MRADARPAFHFLLELLNDLGGCPADEANGALAPFVAERRLHRIAYADPATAVAPEALLHAVRTLVAVASEGGRRAQAVVAA